MNIMLRPSGVHMTVPARSSACFKAAGVLAALGLLLLIVEKAQR